MDRFQRGARILVDLFRRRRSMGDLSDDEVDLSAAVTVSLESEGGNLLSDVIMGLSDLGDLSLADRTKIDQLVRRLESAIDAHESDSSWFKTGTKVSLIQYSGIAGRESKTTTRIQAIDSDGFAVVEADPSLRFKLAENGERAPAWTHVHAQYTASALSKAKAEGRHLSPWTYAASPFTYLTPE